MRSKGYTPLPNSFVGYRDSTFSKQILDVAKTEWSKRFFQTRQLSLLARTMGRFASRAKEILFKICTDTGSYRNRAIALNPGLCDELPFRTIVDTTHFTLKSEGRGLQLADLCAFLIKKHLTDEEAWRFCRHLKHSLIQFPKKP